MSKGIVYACTTIIPGMVKIGRTQTEQFERRMYALEHNGYRNITGVKRNFAIEVENYEGKEILMHTIFAQNRVGDTELFAVDINLVVQLLSALDGKVIYPILEDKETIFEEATETRQSCLIPDGTYIINRFSRRDNKQLCAKATVNNGNWTLLKGSILSTLEGKGLQNHIKAQRVLLNIDNDGCLVEDVDLGKCSPSRAAALVLNCPSDGWTCWTTEDGTQIDTYRKKAVEEEQ